MLKSLELSGFKSFGKKTALEFTSPVTAVVGPNGSGKSNIVEAIRFVLGEQSMKSLRGKAGTDLIFKGSKLLGSPSRAAVSITFDNRKKVFSFSSGSPINIDYDEITISREVYADGANRYLINNSEVRLKDVVELLSSVHIGASGHHIISQGEADRILNSSSKDRRSMVEDALGLKVYQYKIRESERKLEKTQSNMKEVQSLRREIAPHITFLKKQVEKYERANEMREELRALYQEYFAKESSYIKNHTDGLKKRRHELEHEEKRCNDAIASYQAHLSAPKISKEENEIKELENTLVNIRRERDELGRKLGRLEGMLDALMRAHEAPRPEQSSRVMVSRADLDALIGEFEGTIENIFSVNDMSVVSAILKKIKIKLEDFRARVFENHKTVEAEVNKEELATLKESHNALLDELKKCEHKEKETITEISKLQSFIKEESAEIREKERQYYELSAKKSEVVNSLSVLTLQEENLAKISSDFENELRESVVLVGGGVSGYKDDIGVEDRGAQDSLRKRIERIKIKLEDVGGGGGTDIMKEFKDTTERDQFLGRELDDLTESVNSLRTLIGDLKVTLDKEFKQGVEKINKEFQEFFSLMFGGGSAFLTVTVEHKRVKKGAEEGEEDEAAYTESSGEPMDGELDFERGIEITVSLPKKKVKDLHMLSGGERSLTSIALLFAMSQVNPPPFLVLDETDAALDEANSRKYGNMLESLSKYSQLIVVTHNRETMSRAQVLYGITMGAEGASKLLSIKFDEAVQIAK